MDDDSVLLIECKSSEFSAKPPSFKTEFEAFAVAQLRLLAEMIDLGAEGTPGLFVTDTLSDPHAAFESGQGIYREISKSQRLAGEIKRAQPITVVIGNPPYKVSTPVGFQASVAE